MIDLVDINTALSNGLNTFFNGKRCKRGHISERYVVNRACVQCTLDKSKSDSSKAHKLEYRKVNIEKLRKQSRDYVSSGRHKDLMRKRYESDTEWRESRLRSIKSRMRLQRKATPPWADKDDIQDIYKKAKALKTETGLNYQVDHIVPIVHKWVCGLHIPVNLQIILARENILKGNRLSQGF